MVDILAHVNGWRGGDGALQTNCGNLWIPTSTYYPGGVIHVGRHPPPHSSFLSVYPSLLETSVDSWN